MKKIFSIILIALLAVVVSACSESPETALSRAVLASTDVLEFETQGGQSKIIRITSDGDWTCETPEWISVSPASGHAGQTEVTIAVADNFRDGAADVPRKSDVLFKGRSLESIAKVLVRQQGDKFRNPQEYTIDAMELLTDETVVRLKDLTVVALTGKGMIVTDGLRYAYIVSPALPCGVGQRVNVTGVKMSSDVKLAFVSGERIESKVSNDAKTISHVDISSTLDTYRGMAYAPVSVTGEYDGSCIVADGQTDKVVLLDASTSMQFAKLVGHKITVKGFYAGTAAPVVKLIPTTVEDMGTLSTIYFSEDFEWLAPWAAVGDGTNFPAADIVGCDQASTVQPQITKSVVDGVSAEKALIDRGYIFQRYDKNGPNATECIYIQTNYLKFGKTGFQGSMTLPAMPKLESGVSAPTLSFDWYSQRQGSGVFDPTELVVIVANGSNETHYPVPTLNFAQGDKAAWTRAEIKLEGATLDKNTRITIRNADAQLTSAKALRWHIDNITLSKNK